MRSITLSSNSVLLRTTLNSSNPLKFSHFCSTFKLPSPLSRNSRKLYIDINDAKSSNFRYQAYNKSHTNECTTVSDSNQSHNSRMRIEHSQVLKIPFQKYLKFIMLSGIFTLQNTQHAIAASDITTDLSFFGDLGDISTGFASAFLLIFFSELGDKTFFIAALLAARNSAGIVFLGTFGALGVMTIISVALGRTFHYVDDIIPFRLGDTDLPVDDIAAVLLLVYFGVSTLLEASSSDGQKTEEEQKEMLFNSNGRYNLKKNLPKGLVLAATTVDRTMLEYRGRGLT